MVLWFGTNLNLPLTAPYRTINTSMLDVKVDKIRPAVDIKAPTIATGRHPKRFTSPPAKGPEERKGNKSLLEFNIQCFFADLNVAEISTVFIFRYESM